MAKKLRALDLFCGAGGAARGLIAAGFEVVGVDDADQPNYPGEFWQMDYRDLFNEARVLSKTFDFVWSSPPCQAHTALKHAHNAKKHQNLIPGTRRLLNKLCLPWVIENVPGAPLKNPFTLCGSMFGLTIASPSFGNFELRRHRIFETSFEVEPPRCQHYHPVVGVYGGHIRVRAASAGGRGTVDLPGEDRPALAARAMGMEGEGLTMNELSQAIPPAYSKFIAEQWLLSK